MKNLLLILILTFSFSATVSAEGTHAISLKLGTPAPFTGFLLSRERAELCKTDRKCCAATMVCPDQSMFRSNTAIVIYVVLGVVAGGLAARSFR